MTDIVIIDDDEPLQIPKGWTILVVDDDEFVHSSTKLALKSFEYQQQQVTILHAYSGKEALEIIRDSKSDIALALIDVVMETEHAGLTLVKEIRQTLQNHEIRIVLRTGQPGLAPEWDVVNNYDINDYTAKTELTQTRLFTLIISAIRSFEQLRQVNVQNQGLEMMLNAFPSKIDNQSLYTFLGDILEEFNKLYPGNLNAFSVLKRSPLEGDGFLQCPILQAIGKYQTNIAAPLYQALDKQQRTEISQYDKACIISHDDRTLLIIDTQQNQQLLMYFEGQFDKYLEKIFSVFINKISIALDNISLVEQLIDEKDNLEKRIEQRTKSLKLSNDQLKQANDRLRVYADYDHLTSLYSNSKFKELFSEIFELATVNELTLSLLIIELDHHQEFALQHGDNALETIIKKIAKLASNLDSDNRFTAKLSPNKISIASLDFSFEQCVSMAEQLLQDIRNIELFPVTASMGMHFQTPTDQTLIEAYYELAEFSLIDAKDQGRDRLVSRH